MRFVLYAERDLEPITVIELPISPEHVFQYMAGVVRIAVTPPLPVRPMSDAEAAVAAEQWSPIVNVRVHPLMGPAPNRVRTWMLTTDDDEIALLLRSEILPGQRREWHAQFKRGLVTGLMAALGGGE